MSMIPNLFDNVTQMKRELFQPDELSGPSFLYQVVPGNFFAPPSNRPWETFRQVENILKPLEQLSAAVNQMTLREDIKNTADGKFQVNIDVQHFTPQEINVKVVDGNVIVEGRHEEKSDGHGYVSRQFVRRYTLPQGCLPDTVESKLSSDGVLTVTAPRVLPLPSIGEKIVPIIRTGPIQKKHGAAAGTYGM